MNDSEQDPVRKRQHQAILLVMYKLSGGKPGVPCSIEAITQEVNRLQLMQMTDKDFRRLRRQIVDELQALRVQS